VRQQELERRAREQAEERQRRTTLEEFLNSCHDRAIRVETDPTSTTQGDLTDHYERKYPKRIIPWDRSQRADLFGDGNPQTEEMDFPDLQKMSWERFSRDPTFSDRQLFPSRNDLEYVKRTIEKISDEMGLRYYQRDTVENMVRFLLGEIYKNRVLRQEFQLRGHVRFGSHLNLGQQDRSVEQTVEEMTISDPSTPVPRKARNPKKTKGKSKGGRRADQFCIYHRKSQADIPTLAIEYKPPHKLSRDDIVTGLREIKPDRDVIGKEVDDYSFHSMHLMAAVITQLFSYMIRVGVQYGYICTGEAFVFIKIADDPSTVYYYLSTRTKTLEQVNDRHRTAVAQVLAFILHSLAVRQPDQSWHDAADKLDVWNVEYDDILQKIPPTERKDRNPTPYKAGRWKSFTQSPIGTRSRCRPVSGPTGSEDDSPPPPSPSDRRSQQAKDKGKKRDERVSSAKKGKQSCAKRGEQSDAKRGGKSGAKKSEKVTSLQYCTQKCLRGLLTRGALDGRCPNVEEHRRKARGQDRHAISPPTFLRLM